AGGVAVRGLQADAVVRVMAVIAAMARARRAGGRARMVGTFLRLGRGGFHASQFQRRRGADGSLDPPSPPPPRLGEEDAGEGQPARGLGHGHVGGDFRSSGR
ncbi:MAG: hypothetical protein DYG90_14710, partial [Chloroflexi bacterium CFX6]|nr:hypothetical protein [Chloroflexi bacterium CFX6]